MRNTHLKLLDLFETEIQVLKPGDEERERTLKVLPLIRALSRYNCFGVQELLPPELQPEIRMCGVLLDPVVRELVGTKNFEEMCRSGRNWRAGYKELQADFLEKLPPEERERVRPCFP